MFWSIPYRTSSFFRFVPVSIFDNPSLVPQQAIEDFIRNQSDAASPAPCREFTGVRRSSPNRLELADDVCGDSSSLTGRGVKTHCLIVLFLLLLFCWTDLLYCLIALIVLFWEVCALKYCHPAAKSLRAPPSKRTPHFPPKLS